MTDGEARAQWRIRHTSTGQRVNCGDECELLAELRGASGGAILERVTGTAHGANRIAVGAANQRLAQSAHVHVDRAPVDIGIAPPHAVEQLLARQHAAGVLHEEGQQAELGRPQAHLTLAAGDAVRAPIEPSEKSLMP